MKTQLVAYKYRLYPNKSQEILINKTFGCVRYFWNQQVSTFNSYDKITNPSPEFKTSTEIRNGLEWMKEASAAAIQQKEIDFKEFKKQRFSKTRKKSVSNPRFKSKHDRQSYRLPNQKFKVIDDRLQLEKIGRVKVVIDRQLPEGKLMSVTISKNKSGQYYASVLIETKKSHLPKTGKTVGIDVGLKEFLTTSDNQVVNNPRYFRESQAKLKRLQQRLSKKKKGSRRRGKSRVRVARLHQKVAGQRDWFLHNESFKLVRDYDTIVIEDLNVSGMLRNRKLAKSISDVSFSRFFSLLTYKADWYGKEVVKIGRFKPTSKKCSCCGWIKKDLTLKDRTFECEGCGLTIDRDLNAAKNIKALGVDSAIRTQSGCKTVSTAGCDEAFRVKNDSICR